jgi:hypothetical protein
VAGGKKNVLGSRRSRSSAAIKRRILYRVFYSANHRTGQLGETAAIF